jgi:multisubunit Na+/H+ antiporter MnhF subunit
LGILLIPFYLIISCVLLLISITFGLVFIGRIISKDDSQDFKNLMIGYSIIIALFLLKFFSNYIPYFDIIMAIILYSFLFTIAIIGIGSVLRLVLKI